MTTIDAELEDWTGAPGDRTEQDFGSLAQRVASTGLIFLWMVVPSGTNGNGTQEPDPLLVFTGLGQTDSGLSGRLGRCSSTAEDVRRLKKITGFTWAQLAAILGVDRRSVHNWALGESLSQRNASILRQVLAAVAALESISQFRRRLVLQIADEAGSTLHDHLRGHDYVAAQRLTLDIVKREATGSGKRPPALSAEERRRRKGLDLTSLLGSDPDETDD